MASTKLDDLCAEVDDKARCAVAVALCEAAGYQAAPEEGTDYIALLEAVSAQTDPRGVLRAAVEDVEGVKPFWRKRIADAEDKEDGPTTREYAVRAYLKAVKVTRSSAKAKVLLYSFYAVAAASGATGNRYLRAAARHTSAALAASLSPPKAEQNDEVRGIVSQAAASSAREARKAARAAKPPPPQKRGPGRPKKEASGL